MQRVRMTGLPKNGNRAPIAGGRSGQHNLHRVCQTTVTAPLRVGCVVWNQSGPCCCLPTPMTLASGGESDLPACGPPASFSVHLASIAVTPAGFVHKSTGDNVVRMWVQLKRWCVSCV